MLVDCDLNDDYPQLFAVIVECVYVGCLNCRFSVEVIGFQNNL